MDEYREGLFVIAVYLFVITAFSLPPLMIYLYVRITRTINRANKLITNLYEAEEETRKYHE
jgi:hypothetical protein